MKKFLWKITIFLLLITSFYRLNRINYLKQRKILEKRIEFYQKLKADQIEMRCGTTSRETDLELSMSIINHLYQGGSKSFAELMEKHYSFSDSQQIRFNQLNAHLGLYFTIDLSGDIKVDVNDALYSAVKKALQESVANWNFDIINADKIEVSIPDLFQFIHYLRLEKKKRLLAKLNKERTSKAWYQLLKDEKIKLDQRFRGGINAFIETLVDNRFYVQSIPLTVDSIIFDFNISPEGAIHYGTKMIKGVMYQSMSSAALKVLKKTEDEWIPLGNTTTQIRVQLPLSADDIKDKLKSLIKTPLRKNYL